MLIEAHLDGNFINNDLAQTLINVHAIIQGVYDYIHLMIIIMSVLSCCVNICLIYDVYLIPCCENQRDQWGNCLLLGDSFSNWDFAFFFYPFQVKCNNYKQHNPLEWPLDYNCICHFLCHSLKMAGDCSSWCLVFSLFRAGWGSSGPPSTVE